jgi:hypothetical protein
MLVLRKAFLLTAGAIAASAALAADADSTRLFEPDGLADAPAADMTGSNPVAFGGRLELSDEYLSMSDGTYRNLVAFRLDYPLGAEWRASFRLPFVATDQLGGQTTTGDTGLELSWAAVRRETFGLALGSGLLLDSSTEPAGGRGRDALAPFLAAVWRLGGGFTASPSYCHTIGVSGHPWRPEINEGRLRLTLCWRAADGQFWLSLRPEAVFDLEGRSEFFAGSLECGRIVGSYDGEPVALFVRPCAGASSAEGASVGADEPYDYGIAVGLRLGLK